MRKERVSLKKIDLSNVPLNKQGSYDWTSVDNITVPFIYDNLVGELLLIKKIPKTERVLVKYLNNEPKEIKTCHLKKCGLGGILNIDLKSYTHLYKIGDDVSTNRGTIKITQTTTTPIATKKGSCVNRRSYTYQCSKCGYEGEILEYNLKAGKGCAVCAKNKSIRGYSDIATTDQWLEPYIVNKEDMYRCSRNSNFKIKCKCPTCGSEKTSYVYNLVNFGFSCDQCSDSRYFPEKFMQCLLKQLNVKYNYQVSKSILGWSNSFIYDFYIPHLNMIIETHGRQHYTECSWSYSLEEIQKNDEDKRNLAEDNLINYYVEIDCRNSELDWIKTSIENSVLSNVFDLSQINWEECASFAASKLMHKVWEFWNNNCSLMSKKELYACISNEFDIKTNTTITKYLKIGKRLGKCNFYF